MPNQSLGLSQDQRLQMVLAPQLRQSLEMLQVPMMELRAMVRAELEQNPTLEEKSTPTTQIEIEAAVPEQPEEQREMDFRKEFDILARLDSEWKDYFFQEDRAYRFSADDEEKRQYFMDSIPQKVSLQEHLLRQLTFAELAEPEREIGELLIGSINEDGYMTTTVEELASSSSIDVERIRDVLVIVQEFDPPGVGARDLRDCLILQLERLGQNEGIAAHIVRDHLERLAGKKYPDIARALGTTSEEVQKAANFISTLDPKPGSVYSSELSPYVLPEVVVKRLEGHFVVILNDDELPRVRISKYYRALMDQNDTTTEVKNYIQERVRAGMFLIKSINQRQQTIHKIASEIVRVQEEFLEKGIAHLKPLTMAEVATVVGLHETTVSRAVSGKHMQTPSGIFEMKYFFTPGLKTADGQNISNKTVKDMISSMVAGEDSGKPLSDQEILEQLTQKGIQIARRTIAKYRIALRIPPSHLRKQY